MHPSIINQLIHLSINSSIDHQFIRPLNILSIHFSIYPTAVHPSTQPSIHVSTNPPTNQFSSLVLYLITPIIPSIHTKWNEVIFPSLHCLLLPRRRAKHFMCTHRHTVPSDSDLLSAHLGPVTSTLSVLGATSVSSPRTLNLSVC